MYHYIYSKILLVICLLVIVSAKAGNTSNIKLNVTGFEKCIFNLVVVPHDSKDIPTTDFVEHFVVSNREALQLWTISTMSVNETSASSLTSQYLKEIYSINIVVSIVGCSELDLFLVLESRVFNPNSILYIVLEPRKSRLCLRPDRRTYFSSRVIVDIISLEISSNNKINQAAWLCMSCIGTGKQFLPIPYQQLMRIRRLSVKARNHFAKPLVALISHHSSGQFSTKQAQQCRHLYNKRRKTKPRKIGCFSRHLLIENIAARLNYTVDYFPTNTNLDSVLMHDNILVQHVSVIVVLGQMDWNKLYNTTVSTDNLVKQVLRGVITVELLYCTKTIEREGFSFLFWTVPFDNWSWVLIGASVLVLILILRGQWFPVFAILMRQDCRILRCRHTKLLMVFILATIIFTYGYEGVVSSLLTAQPPLMVFKTLKELLGVGYKIYAISGTSLTPYRRILEKENITGTPESKMVFSDWTGTSDELSNLAQCNLTFVVQTELKIAWKSAINKAYDKISCKYVRNSRYSYDTVFQYFGEYYLRFAVVEDLMIQSGIWSYYTAYEKYIQDLPNIRRVKVMEYNEGLPVVFTISDWKMLSIFIVWAGLLISSFLVFIVDYLHSNMYTMYGDLLRSLHRVHRTLKFMQIIPASSSCGLSLT